MENLTMDYMNETTTPPEVDMFPNIYRTVAGSCIFILVLPFVLFHFKFFPVRTTMAVLLGAMLMVTFNVITQSEVYEIIGKRHNLTTIFLLLGMALIAEYFEREQLVGKLLRIFLKSEQHFVNYLVRVCVFSFVLSMIFTNDGCCLLLTPVLLRCWEEQERSRNELETLLLGVATSANIGSVTTVFGNAVLALISARTYSNGIGNFNVDLLTCFQYLLPPAIVCFWINFVFLCGHYRIKSRRCGSARCLSERQSTEQELSGLTRNSHHLDLAGTNGYLKQEQDDYCNGYGFREERLAHPPTLETILEDEILELPEASTWIVDSSPSHNVQESSFASGDTQVKEESDGLTGMRSCTATEDLTCIDEEFTAQSSPTNSQPSNPAASGNLSRLMDQEGLSPSSQSGIYRSLSGISTADFLSTRFQRYDQETMGGSRILQASIVLVILAIFSLLLVSTDFITFDIGLVPLGGSLILVALDTIINRKNSPNVIKRVDWSVIMMFFAVFVWIQGFVKTDIPMWVWKKLGFYDSTFTDIASILVLSFVVVVTVNLFGQVPMTIIILSLQSSQQLRLVLYLAWAATIGGNITLLSSVSNAIVAQKSLQSLNFQLTFCSFLRFGLPSSVLLLGAGIGIISFILMLTETAS